MDINKAKETAKVMNRIKKCESFLKSLKGRMYNHEFAIYYRGIEMGKARNPISFS